MRNPLSFVLFSLLSVLVGCASLERSIVRGKVRDAFTATMTPGTEVADLGGGLHTLRWLSYRTMWLETPEGTIVFDPLNRDAAGELARQLVARHAPPVRAVIYSHGHRDHAAGADVFAGHPAIIAHREVAAEIASRHYDDVATPTETFDEDRHVLPGLTERVELITLRGAHSDALTATYFPSRRLLYVVDLVWPDQLPPPAAPLSYGGVSLALDQLLALDFDTFVPGHGRVATRAEVARYRRFLTELRGEFMASLRRHQLSDLNARATFLAAPDRLGAVFFEVIDALEPRYGSWVNFDQAILATVQWAFWSVLTGD